LNADGLRENKKIEGEDLLGAGSYWACFGVQQEKLRRRAGRYLIVN